MTEVNENSEVKAIDPDQITEATNIEIQPVLKSETTDLDELEAQKRENEEEDEKDIRIKNLSEGNKKMSSELLRARADYENLKRRSTRERFEEIKRAKKALFLNFLEILDNFERALDAVENHDDSFVQGIEMIHKQFLDVLSQGSVYEIKAEGTEFNPHMHEAMVQFPTNDYPENTVVQVFQKGYSFNGELLRPSQVSVATPAPSSSNDEKKPSVSEEDSSSQEDQA
ncbi:MAG: nucleotide exchange factor GrpE [Acidobacteria bacterium]|nr:MAG: nucleotide exchange factor GrpE [Acidobacteriota bacterium]